jgi:hypothetical protein
MQCLDRLANEGAVAHDLRGDPFGAEQLAQGLVVAGGEAVGTGEVDPVCDGSPTGIPDVSTRGP